MLETCAGCRWWFWPEEPGQIRCGTCLHLASLQHPERATRPRQERQHRQQTTRRPRGKYAYVVVHDPLGDYAKGATIPSWQLKTTLACSGFNPGTVLERGAVRHVVVGCEGRLALQRAGK